MSDLRVNTAPTSPLVADVVVIGAGPAGLMAAQVLTAAGRQVHVMDAMPSIGRKFLLAGKGGLNLTHSENRPAFDARYGDQQAWVCEWLDKMDAPAVCKWAADLGVDTFVGSSGRVFPSEMKAAPLLRAWQQRLRHPLRGQPVQFHVRHRWVGWDDAGDLVFEHGQQRLSVRAAGTVLALGGASWPQLGSDGAWVPLLQARGAQVSALRPANCGFDVLGPAQQGWSAHFASRFAGQPLKSISVQTPSGDWRKGECVITQHGLEGSLVYAVAAQLRDEIARHGGADCVLDLLPDWAHARVLKEIQHPRGSRSLSGHLKGRLGLHGVKAGLLHEFLDASQWADAHTLSDAIKGLRIRLAAPRPVAEAISTAGGVSRQALTPGLMLKGAPNVHCAGEMLDWEAPTGGYLLTACLASGQAAAMGLLANL